MLTGQLTKTFLLTAEEGGVNGREGVAEGGVRTASKLSKTAHLTPYDYQ